MGRREKLYYDGQEGIIMTFWRSSTNDNGFHGTPVT